MLIFLVALLCTVSVQSIIDEEVGRTPVFDFSAATPPRNVFPSEINLKLHAGTFCPALKIVNGQPATRGQFCYQVYLKFSDGRETWSCGGSLIAPALVLTAAHCARDAKQVKVVLGALDLSKKYEPGRVVIYVSSSGMQIHEKYDSKKIINDIAVIKLPKSVESKDICTVKIPSASTKLTADSDNKNNYTVSGWGRTSDTTRTSKLMYMEVPQEPQQSCATFFRTESGYNIVESQMCTSGAGGKSTCNGDSGGPLVQPDSSGNIVLRGIVSFGPESCMLCTPSVYTDLQYYLDWLSLWKGMNNTHFPI